MTLFCGIDWAETHHDVAIIHNDGQLVAKKRIPDDPAGFAQLIEMLADAGDDSGDRVPVAIETPRGLLVAALRATGRPVYAINPLAVARYRERHSVARAKSDHADATTLASILRVDAHLHRRLPADSELCQAIAVLARAHQDAIWARTKAHHQLRSQLREFYPTFLAVFTSRFTLGIASPEALAVLAIATDNGAEFQSSFHWHVLDQGIGHIYIRPATPRLNGKVERSHRIDAEEFYRLLDGVVEDDAGLFNQKLREWED